MQTKYDIGDKLYALNTNGNDDPISINIVIICGISIDSSGTEYFVKDIWDDTEWGSPVPEDDISRDIKDLLPRFIMT